MPIPHLAHKIHSPNAWKDDSSRKADLKKPPKFRRGRFWLLKLFKNSGGRRLTDIRFGKKFPRGPKEGWFKKLKRWAPYVIAVLLIFILLMIGLVAWLSKGLPDPNKLSERNVAQSTKIYDRTGEHLLYDIHGEQQRTLIQLSDIPDYAIKATLTLEDQQFYKHKGFNLWGMFRGVVLQTLKGGRAQGGSTLTQQLVKNAILGDERSVLRKLKELILAYRLEKKYSKDEILQMYFNEIPYGSTAYGIEAAASLYFGKSAKDLTLAEATILAALPQRPTYFSPNGSHVDELIQRQHYCLDQMVKLGYLAEAEAQTAKEEELDFKNRVEGIEAPHFVFFVKELLSEKYGDTLVEQGGFKIISSLDYDLQKKAEEIIKEQVEKNLVNFNAGNAALVAIDVKTGQILAMVGSKDYFDDEIDGQVNVTTSPRQPGSSFKPIVYATAFNRGYVPETVIYDLETVFPVFDGNYIPHNYDLKERGPVSLRTALAGSLNIPAVKMIYLAGIENVLNLADNLDYTTLKDRSRFGLSLVLGGGEVKLLEHVNAYATFARDGKKMRYEAVLKLEDGKGKVLEEYKKPYMQKTLEPDIARMINDILSDNNARAFTFGASNYLTLGDRPAAAKTGTTNDYHDAWTIGYTPQLAVGVWVGNSNNDEMKRGADGSVVAAPIWNRFMKEALANQPIASFIKPAYQIPNKPMLGGEADGVKVAIDKLTGLLATENTPEQLREEKLFKQAHAILQYVNKENPLGPAPDNPGADPYYANWEAAVQKWAQANNITNQEPPTEYDNLHLAEDKPKVSFLSPEDNATIDSAEISLNVRTDSPRGIAKVEYYLDDKLISLTTNPPFNADLVLPSSIPNGRHSLTAKAYDDLQNAGEASLTVNLQRTAFLNIEWLQPAQGTTIPAGDFPYNLMINVDDLSKVKKIDFYYKASEETSSAWINYVDNPTDNNIRVLWLSPPPSGVYKVYPVVTIPQGGVINGPEITVSVE